MAAVGDEAMREHRLQKRVGSALRDTDRTAEVGDGQALGAGVGERFEQAEGPLDALDALAFLDAHNRSVLQNDMGETRTLG